MAKIALLKQNLAIEPDLQNFIGFILTAVEKLGGGIFAACQPTLDLVQQLRQAGAATGYPLLVNLTLDDNRLLAEWTDADGNTPQEFLISGFRTPPAPGAAEQLRQHFLRSTEAADPAILLQRNAEMARHLEETRARTEKEIETMQQALAQRQEELYESLRQAESDPLTGLFNRRAFDVRLEHAFRRALRQKGEHLCLMLLDLDFFKKVNDEYGHQFGDAYLNKMAHTMRSVIRTDVDFAFRIGGDEFAMLLFADENTTCLKAMQILRDMENKVSMGIASVSSEQFPSENPESFFQRADNALYQAKRAGRGRVVVDSCREKQKEGCKDHCGRPAS